MQYIGVTEAGDPSFSFKWVDKLYDANIIISKNLNDRLIEELINHKEKIIFHCTCTGMGGTIIEPNVPNVGYTRNQLLKLVDKGFPQKQIVLRIDPIIPTAKGLETVENILYTFKTLGIKRVRYSFLDMYKHVKTRFIGANVRLPYWNFNPSQNMINNALELFKKYPEYEFESCAENTPHKLGCISQKDLDILGVDIKPVEGGLQRKGCLCLGNKKELLSSKKRCMNKCLYCYWKD